MLPPVSVMKLGLDHVPSGMLHRHHAVAAAPADDQAGLDGVGDDHDRRRFVEQLVGDRVLGDGLDVGEHAQRVAGALVLAHAGEGGLQARGEQQRGHCDGQGTTGLARHGELHDRGRGQRNDDKGPQRPATVQSPRAAMNRERTGARRMTSYAHDRRPSSPRGRHRRRPRQPRHARRADTRRGAPLPLAVPDGSARRADPAPDVVAAAALRDPAVAQPARRAQIRGNLDGRWLAARRVHASPGRRRAGSACRKRAWCMRCATASPSVGEVLAGLRRDGVARAVVLPLYPQYSTTTTASVDDAVRQSGALPVARDPGVPPRCRVGAGRRRFDQRALGCQRPRRHASCSPSTACRSASSTTAIRMPRSARPASRRSRACSACTPTTTC